MKKNILIVCILVIALVFCFSNTDAYYGGYGLMGGLMGMYGGYGMMGLYGGYGLMGGLMGLYGGYGLMGGMMGMYGGYGMMGMYSPFSYYNMYYPVQTSGGLTYQVPFLQIAPLLGIAGLYNQLFPNLFNPQPVNIPTSYNVTFPTPVGVVSVT